MKTDNTEKKPLTKKQKIGRIVESTVMVLFLAILLTIVISLYLDKKNGTNRGIFGYTFSVVVTGSMEPEIHVGDLIVSKNVDITEVKEGDDVVFIAKSGAVKGQKVIHKVMDVATKDGEIIITTKGVAEGATEDREKVTKANYVGKLVGQSTFFGKLAIVFGNIWSWLFLLVIYIVIRVVIVQVKKAKKQIAEEKAKQMEAMKNDLKKEIIVENRQKTEEDKLE